MDDQPYPWMEAANCASVGGDPFFPEKGDSVRAAKRICADCPVAEECLQFAVARGIRFGVWGGKTAQQRARTRREAA